jgi:hypothetical protein
MKIENRQQILGAAAIALVGLFLLDKIVITPLIAGWKKRASEIVELQKKIDNGEKLIARGPQLEDKWTNMRTNTLAAESAERKLLEAFQRWSDQSRITISSIQPTKREEDDHVSQECRASLAGDVGTLSRFLYAMEKDPMALRVESLEITAKDESGRNLQVGLTVSGLILTEAQE